jgi:hypothetical protein
MNPARRKQLVSRHAGPELQLSIDNLENKYTKRKWH